MTRILFQIVRICNSQFKCNYLKNEKLFLIFFPGFLESTSNFIHFEKKDDGHSYFISENTDCEKRKLAMTIILFFKMLKLQTVKVSLKLLSKNCRFRTLFESQHVERSQTFAKGAWEHFSHLFSSF